MIQQILVPTDFSECALHAVDYTLHLAEKSKASVYLFHAYQPFHSGFQGERDNARDELRAREDAVLGMQEFVAKLNKKARYSQIKTGCYKGTFLKALESVAEEQGSELIVMGTTSAAGLKDLLGSYTLNVARSTEIPLLVLPEKALPARIEKVAFLTDFHDDDVQTLVKLIATFGKETIQYELIHIYEPDGLPGEDIVLRLSTWAEKMREEVGLPKLDHELIHGKENIKMVQEIAERHDLDILAITVSRRGFFEKLLHKSLAKAIILQSETPVFIG